MIDGMTATVHQLPRPTAAVENVLHAINNGTYASGGVLTAYKVTHLSFDLELGWSIELARGEQSTAGETTPHPVDLPEDVRRALLQFLGVNSDKVPA